MHTFSCQGLISSSNYANTETFNLFEIPIRNEFRKQRFSLKFFSRVINLAILISKSENNLHYCRNGSSFFQEN